MSTSLAASLAPITLPDPEGHALRLGELWERGPAVVVFLRHYGCIFCRKHAAQLRAHEDDFRAAGARLAAIGLADRAYARTFRAETGIGFPLLVDEQREAYRVAGLGSASVLHLLYPKDIRARRQARAEGHRQVRLGLGSNPFQLGGSFVFGPGNVDRFAHVSTTFGDNADPSALLAALRG